MSNNSLLSPLSVCFSKKNLVLLSRHKSACSSIVFMLKELLQIGKKALRPLLGLKKSLLQEGSSWKPDRGCKKLCILSVSVY